MITSINGGSSPAAGSGFDVVVRSADADGDFATVNADTAIQLARKAGTGDLGGTLTGTILQGTNQVTISGVTYTKAEEGVQLTASRVSGNSLDEGDSAAFTVLPGTPTKYLVTASDSSPAAGDQVTVSAQLADANGNSVSTSGITVNWTTDEGTLSDTSTLTDSNGVAQVTLTTDTAAGVTHQVTGTDDSGLTGTSGNITTVAGAAAKYLVTVSDEAPVAGEPVDLEAQLADANGNPVATAGVTVTWTVDPSLGSFDSPTSVTDARGIAKQRYMSWVIKDKYGVTARDGANNEGTVEINSVDSLLKNWAFEIDANPKNGRPDNWGNNASFTRSNTVKFSGRFAGRHRSAGNANYTIQQTVNGLTPGKTYDFLGRVNVQPTNDNFTLTLQVQWRNNANNPVGAVVVVKQYTKANATGTWDEGASQDLLAPAGATRARIAMVVKKLNATIYVDQFSFREQPA